MCFVGLRSVFVNAVRHIRMYTLYFETKPLALSMILTFLGKCGISRKMSWFSGCRLVTHLMKTIQLYHMISNWCFTIPFVALKFISRLSSWCRKVCTKLSNDFHGIFPRISWPQTIQDPTIRSLKKTPKKTVYFPWNQWGFLQDNPIYETVMDADIVTNGVSTDVLLEKFEESLGAARASRGSVGGHGVVENLYRKRGRGREREKVFIHFSTTTQVDRVKIWSGRWLGIFLGSMLKFDKRRSKYMGTIYYMVWQAKTGSFLPQQIEGFDYGKWVMQWTIKKWLTGFDQSQTGMHPEIDQETSKIGWSLGFFCDRGLCNRKILRLSPP